MSMFSFRRKSITDALRHAKFSEMLYKANSDGRAEAQGITAQRVPPQSNVDKLTREQHFEVLRLARENGGVAEKYGVRAETNRALNFFDMGAKLAAGLPLHPLNKRPNASASADPQVDETLHRMATILWVRQDLVDGVLRKRLTDAQIYAMLTDALDEALGAGD